MRTAFPSRSLAAGLLCTLVAMTAGCQSYSAPKLSASEARATERTADGAAMRFILSAENENEVALPLRTIEYRLALNGREVFAGTRSAEATLRRKGSQSIALPAVVRLSDTQNADLITGATKYRLSGQVYYVTPGQLAEVLFDAGVRTPSADFVVEGEIDLSNAQFIPAASAGE